MKYFKRFLKYAIPYKWTGIISVFLNVMYALFSALSFLTLIPMLNVLFGDSEKIHTKPYLESYASISKEYLENYLNYLITINTENFGPESTLTYMVIRVFCRIIYGIPKKFGTQRFA